jgi:hypothetical protein
VHAALAPPVVAEARSGTYYYSNNGVAEMWNPEFFTDALGKDNTGHAPLR